MKKPAPKKKNEQDEQEALKKAKKEMEEMVRKIVAAGIKIKTF